MTQKLIRIRELQEIIPWSRITFWRKERDGEFPKRMRIGKNSCAWNLNEIEGWLAQKRDERNFHSLKGGKA